jgi:hypothetical protein
MTGRGVGLWIILLVQVLSAFFFVSDILSSLLGYRSQPISWQSREMIEIGAAVGLVLGLVFGGLTLWREIAEKNDAQAGGPFHGYASRTVCGMGPDAC